MDSHTFRWILTLSDGVPYVWMDIHTFWTQSHAVGWIFIILDGFPYCWIGFHAFGWILIRLDGFHTFGWGFILSSSNSYAFPLTPVHFL